jgi:hypothetical protein
MLMEKLLLEAWVKHAEAGREGPASDGDEM